MVDLRLGRWQEVLADVGEVDAVITDPPYSARTHEGSDGAVGRSGDGAIRQVLGYGAWSDDDVAAFVAALAPRTRSWFCALTDDILIPAWRAAFRESGRYDFAPVPVLQHRPRLTGDGPASCAIYLVASRPRERRFAQWGSLPGWYEAPPERGAAVMGAKPIGLMRAIVRDYSRPGDLICDPCAGGATTLIAAAMEGRRAVGSEMDPKTYALAQARIAKGHTPDMFSGQQ